MAGYEIDKEQLKKVIHRDCELMLSFYLGDKLTLGVPEFHKELWDEFIHLLDEVNRPELLVGVLKKLLGVPREHAKTTLVKVAIILFMRYSRLRFTAYISNTFPSARNALIDVVNWFNSANEIELYGQPTKEKHNESEGLFIYNIWVPGRDKPKKVIMKAFGVETQIRGMNLDSDRPDLMIFDDVESRETAGSLTQQSKLDANIMGTALKAMAKMGLAVFIGNMITETTLLARLSKEPEWRATVFGSIIRNKEGTLVPLWPERWTLDDLLNEYAAYRRLAMGHVWEAEMMNLTSKETLGESLEKCPRPPVPLPEEVQAGFLCLDPAFGEKAWNDESAITVHALLHGGDIPVVIESWRGRVREEALLDQLVSMSYRWGITSWVIEAQAAQKLLIPLFRALLVQRSMSPDLFLMIPILATKDSKASRIVAFRTVCAKGSYAICDSEQDLVEKLEGYAADAKVHDDLCDSAAYGTIVWALHGTVIEGQGRQDIAGAMFGHNGGPPIDSGEICPF